MVMVVVVPLVLRRQVGKGPPLLVLVVVLLLQVGKKPPLLVLVVLLQVGKMPPLRVVLQHMWKGLLLLVLGVLVVGSRGW